jgi:predicted MPP superfamily phosphohydrolase
MRPLAIFSFIILFITAMDLYAYRGILWLSGNNSPWSVSWNNGFTLVYFGSSLLMVAGLIWAGSRFQGMRDPSRFFGVTLIIGIFLMLYVPKLIFNLSQLIGDLGFMIARILTVNCSTIKKWIMIPGAFLGIFLFVAFGMGMLRGRTNVKVFTEKIRIKDLPAAFEGLEIVQLSDIHLAGFYHHPEQVEGMVKKVNGLKPDLILFTGDMVHNFSEEIDPFVETISKLEAPLGKYAVLGNHDYGTYYRWESKKAETANLERVKEQIRNSGFDLLLNEHRTLEVDGQALEIVGVENWGKPPFPQEGDLERALSGTDPGGVKILLSHDPSHWDLQVKGMGEIPLTLSGHTHGMQFGIELGDFKWSPSRWTYRYWAGLYSENGQHLYVNRGFGYTGFPGRVGIRPEITRLILYRE